MVQRSVIPTPGWKTLIVQKPWYVLISLRKQKQCQYQQLNKFHPSSLSPSDSGFCWGAEQTDHAIPGAVRCPGSVPPAPHWALWPSQIQLPLQEREEVLVKEKALVRLKNTYRATAFNCRSEVNKTIKNDNFPFLFQGTSTFITRVSKTRKCCMCRTLWMELPLYSLTRIHSQKMALWLWEVSPGTYLACYYKEKDVRAESLFIFFGPLSIQWAACQRSVNILPMVWAAVVQTG